MLSWFVVSIDKSTRVRISRILMLLVVTFKSVDRIKRSAEHDYIGVVVGKAKDPKSNNIPPFRELAQWGINSISVTAVTYVVHEG